MSYEVVHKPTFTNQLLAVPPREWPHIMEKLRLLQEAPAPDAKSKKRLVGYEGAVYRIRSGNYRIVYSFSEREHWVVLLGVDNRKDVYKGEQLLAEAPAFDPALVPDADGLLALKQQGHATPPIAAPITEFPPPAVQPIRLDEALLQRLRVSDEHAAVLRACRTADDLLAADVPPEVRERVLDALTAPDYDRVLQQPSFVTGDVDDLLTFAQGELLGFLLKLNPEQEKFVDWAVRGAGATLVRGGPGTGKSTVALYRARAMIAALRATGVAQPRLLFTTYTTALVASSQQLLHRLLEEDAAVVTVRTADSLVMEFVTAADGPQHPANAPALQAALQEAQATALFEGNALQRRAQARTIEGLSSDYLLEELLSVIVARELGALEAYLATPRAGRRVSLNVTQRTAVWKVYEAFARALQRQGVRSWQGLRRRAAELARAGRAGAVYDAVIVDEAQDLDASVLRLLVMLCRTPDRLFITADANQSIYGSGFRWTDVHADLRFTGRTGVLRANHRSTREIGEAAYSYLQDGTLEEADEGTERRYMVTGPQPAVRAVASAYDETQLLARFIQDAAKAFRLGIAGGAVLVPSERTGQAIAGRLRDVGVAATFMAGRDLDLEQNTVKVLTLKSAKGLEFPFVAVAGLLDGPVPGAAKGVAAEEAAETNSRERRTMYVAMTRAMRALLVVLPANHTSPLLKGFDAHLWNMGATADA